MPGDRRPTLQPPAMASCGLARLLTALFLFFGVTLGGCSRTEPAPMPQYATQPPSAQQHPHLIFAVHPLYNPQTLHQKYLPLMHYLEQHVPGARFDLEASVNYTGFEDKLMRREPDFALPNPYEAVQAWDWGYHVIAKMAGDDNFRGVLIVRKDSAVKEAKDLIGKTVSYPAPTALAATMLTQLYLQDHGVDVLTQTKSQYVGTHTSVLMNAYLGLSAAGATSPRGWAFFQQAYPKEASEMQALWRTPALIQNPVMARADLPAPLVQQVRTALLQLNQSVEGQQVVAQLDIEGFEAAEDAQYKPVAAFAQAYKSRVRKEQ